MLQHGDAGPLTPLARTYLDKASQATERLAHCIDDLLRLQRIDANQETVTATNFEIVGVLHEAMEALTINAHRKSLTITSPPRGPLYAFGDREATKHIVENLLDNAIKYTTTHGRIDLAVEHQGAHIQLRITDTGVGIPKRAHARIFDRFIRIPNPLSTHAGGSGLGLAIVKQLVEWQGGTITVESHLRKGSTFAVTLPAAVA
jgi:two-component system phosphate regulon sensor histidine kinase PhoR